MNASRMSWVVERRAMIDAHVAQRLREARAGLDLSQAELAHRFGFTQAAVSLWEHGVRKVSIAELDRLAAALGKPLSYFLDWPLPEVTE
jgi:transcriptional regulator with XRE-family HTH domain